MALPSFFSDGSTPRRTDTRLIVWKKILGVIQDGLGGGADPDNDPKQTDTLRQTKQKVLKAEQ